MIKEERKKILSKVTKISMVSLMIVGAMFSNVSNASAKGAGAWETKQYDTGLNTTATQSKPYGMVAHTLTNVRNRTQKYTTFCVQHGVDIDNNTVYDGIARLPDTAKMREASKVAFLGWYKSEGDLFITDSNFTSARKKKYAFTNQYIWDVLGQNPEKFVEASVQTEYENWKKQIEIDKDKLQKKPSFNGAKENVKAGESKVLTDTNGVLKDYENFEFTDKGITFKHIKGQDTMTISVPKNCEVNNYLLTEGKAIDNNAVKGNTGDESEVVHFSFTNYGANDGQDQLYANSYIDPIAMSLRLDIQLFGDVEIAKKDNKDNFVPNTEFKLSYNADMSSVIGTYKTGTNGKVKVEGLKSQTVYVQEVSVPNHLTLDSTVRAVTVKANETVSYTAVNNWKSGRVDLIKEDKETGSNPQGDAVMDTAKYTVRAKGNIPNPYGGEPLYKDKETISIKKINGNNIGDVGVKQVDKNLSITWQNLPIGEYEVFESEAPEGYLIDETIYHVSITSNNPNDTVITKSVKSKEQVKKGKLQISKSGTEGLPGVVPGLKDVEFTMKLVSDVQANGWDKAKIQDVLVTNDFGIATSKDLPYGLYRVKETFTPENYMAGGDFFVFVGEKDGEIVYRLVNNVPFRAWLKLVKVDEHGNQITLSSATFKLKDEEGNYVKQKVGQSYKDEWTTDENGIAFLDNMVLFGTYTIEEIKAPAGFIVGEDVQVDITADNPNITFDDDNEPIITATIVNNEPKGKIELTKTLEDVEDIAEFKDIIKFKLSAEKDVVSATNGKILFKAGEVVTIDHEDGIYTIDENGKLVIENLPLGVIGASYRLEEVETADGYVLLEEPIIFEFKIGEEIQQEYVVSKTVENKLTETEFSKTDLNGKELEGGEYSLLDEDGNVFDEWIGTGSNHIIKGLSYEKKYIYRENLAPAGFTLAQDVEFIYSKEMNHIVMKDSQVELVKTDDLGNLLAGAKFDIEDVQGNVVETVVSSDTERVFLNYLKVGETYVIKEVDTPEGHKTAEDIIFTVLADENLEIKVVNEIIRTDLMVNKVDSFTKENIISKDFKFGMYADEECTKLIATVNANQKDGTAVFKDVPFGTVYFKEVEAPKGYELSNEVKKIVVDENLEGVGEVHSFIYENSLMEMVVIKTADVTNIKLYAGLFAVGAIASVYLVLKSKKKKEDKE